MHLARAEILCNASAFHRRIVEPLQKFPHRWLLLGKRPDNTACEERQLVARQILETPDSELETSTRKIKTVFRDDLQAAAKSGHLVGRMRVCLRAVAVAWKADTRECERVNKMLKLFTVRGPPGCAQALSGGSGDARSY